MPPTTPRLAVLDGLRFAAASAVLVYHFVAVNHHAWGERTSDSLPAVQGVAAYGSFGVQLFFVVSGFVILMTAWGRDVRGFVASRAGRLFPAYWAAVLLTLALLVLVIPGRRDVDLPQAAANLTMVQRAFGIPDLEAVYWTLWSELRFYVLVGVLVAVGLTRARVVAFVVLWPVAGEIAARTGSDLVATVLVAPDAPLFAGGMVLYLLTRERRSPVLWLALALDVALAAAVSGRIQAARIENSTDVVVPPAVWWVAIVLCFAVVAVATLTPLARVSWGWLTALGALTYPLYLVHASWGRWVIESVHPYLPRAATLTVAVAACLLLAWAVHRAVERPLGPRLRRTLDRDLRRDPGRPGRRTPARQDEPVAAR
ncbi:acyltransferase family protein [Cellulosimicrobium cellulans]|uniref:acyltransferase family protein n=1 Tax=Cellulosimicrobium cellulans TaxID=1710 RepID=UPI0020977BB7|nr:acyltransferase [Cellulosimicrobium cellulans]MCO7272265.1 acyltransferase [Cellulosimicrobium cellulans]